MTRFTGTDSDAHDDQVDASSGAWDILARSAVSNPSELADYEVAGRRM